MRATRWVGERAPATEQERGGGTLELGEELGWEMPREGEIVLHHGLICVLIIMYKLIYQQGFGC